MCEKLGARLRHHHFQAQHFFAGLLSHELGWFGSKAKALQPTDDSKEIFQLAGFLIYQHWHGEPVSQIQVTALIQVMQDYKCDFFIKPM